MVVECTPNIKKIGEAKSVDDGYLVCTVNSFISDKLKPYDFAKGDDYHSYTRYSVVMDNCINNVKNNDPVVETQKLLKGEYGFMCQYDDEPDLPLLPQTAMELPIGAESENWCQGSVCGCRVFMTGRLTVPNRILRTASFINRREME